MSTRRHSDMIRKRAKKPAKDGLSQSAFAKAVSKSLRKFEDKLERPFNPAGGAFGGPRHD